MTFKDPPQRGKRPVSKQIASPPKHYIPMHGLLDSHSIVSVLKFVDRILTSLHGLHHYAHAF
jgi:hypothetical protein